MASIAQQIDIPGLIAAGSFQRRPLSWVCALDDYWIKIPRKSANLARDARDPDVFARAAKQYGETGRLRALDERILAPIELDEKHACLIYRRLHGKDLHATVLAAESAGQITPALKEAIGLCARLHRIPEEDDRLNGLVRQDYLSDPEYPAGGSLAEEITAHAHTVVVGGMLIRNYMWDREGGSLYFFDPHGVFIGIPEEDAARFILSLVMATWGRRSIRWRVWELFDPDELLDHYETVSGRKLSPSLLRYGMDLHVARRWRYAKKSISSMQPLLRAPATAWGRQYFKQIQRWRKQHGI
jgi:hypothetical protein